MENPNPEPVLCYIDDGVAYFTPIPLAEQWGDDWNDAPYEHNAGSPYNHGDSHTPHEIVRIHFESFYETPAQIANGNSHYSVEQINQKRIPWLLPDRYTSIPMEAIWAGTTLSEFKRLIRASGGQVYVLEKG